jgi:hypothetical protein
VFQYEVQELMNSHIDSQKSEQLVVKPPIR